MYLTVELLYFLTHKKKKKQTNLERLCQNMCANKHNNLLHSDWVPI